MSKIRLATLLCVWLVSACGDDDHTRPPGYAVNTLLDGLLFTPLNVADDEQRALLVDVSGAEPKTAAYELPAGVVTALPRPGPSVGQVVMLTGGLDAVRSGRARRPAVPSFVLIFARAGEQRRVPLQGRYQKLALSPDGRYAIAFGSSAGLSVDNSAEVIDFEGSAAPVFVDLSLDARAPSEFVFSAPGAFPHKVAVAPQPNALQVLDLEHPENGPISITLTSAQPLVPAQLSFAGKRLFVRNQNSEQLVILESIEVPRGKHQWQLAPGQQFASSPVRDIAVIGSGDAQRLLALTDSLEVFDPAIGPTAKVSTSFAFDKILQFEGASPVDSRVAPRALLYSTASGSSRIAFIDLGDETAWSTRNIEVVDLGDAVVSLLPLATRPLAVARHVAARASVIDLQQRSVRRLVLDEYSESLLLDETASVRQLWARGPIGELGRVNLDDFSRIELPFAFGQSSSELDSVLVQSAPDLFVVPSLTRRRLAIRQRGHDGRVTFLDADAPTGDAAAESAFEVLGIYLSDLLQ